MPEKIREVQPPTGIARLAFRLPIFLYRLGLGRLLGDRFLELTHTGRKSGLPRHTVLEVVRHDRETGVYYVAAGFGEKSDWYQNIRLHPQVEVRSAGKRLPAIAEFLLDEDAGNELVRYAHDHPLAFRELPRVMGYRLDGSDADTYALGQYIRMVALKTGGPDQQETG